MVFASHFSLGSQASTSRGPKWGICSSRLTPKMKMYIWVTQTQDGHLVGRHSYSGESVENHIREDAVTLIDSLGFPSKQAMLICCHLNSGTIYAIKKALMNGNMKGEY